MRLRWVAALMLGLWACGTEVEQSTPDAEPVMEEDAAAIATLSLEVTFTEAPETRGFLHSYALDSRAVKRHWAGLRGSRLYRQPGRVIRWTSPPTIS